MTEPIRPTGSGDTRIEVGLIPIMCTAPLALADARGLFASRGLEVQFRSPPGWGGIRELLAYDKVDAAHVLSPMPLATRLGLDGFEADIRLDVIQNINGQALTLHVKHRHVTEARDFVGFRFGVPHAFSMHYYLLCDYLAAHGLDPRSDVEIVEVSPPTMPAYLRNQWVDGVLAPEPFNQLAVDRGVGVIHVLSRDIAPGHPCCAVASTARFVDERPEVHRAFVDAVIEAEQILHDATASDLPEIIRLIGGPGHLDLPSESSAFKVLCGEFHDGRGHHHTVHDRIDFVPGVQRGHGVWLLERMRRWGQVSEDVDTDAVLDSLYLRSDSTPTTRGPVVHLPDEPVTPAELAAIISPLVDAIAGDTEARFPSSGSAGTRELGRLLDELLRGTRYTMRRLEDRETSLLDAESRNDATHEHRALELRQLYSATSLLQSCDDPRDVMAEIAELLTMTPANEPPSATRITLDGALYPAGREVQTAAVIRSFVMVDTHCRGEIELFRAAGLRTSLHADQQLLDAVADSIATALGEHENRTRYADLYEHAPDMYVSVDPATGLVTECNQTMLEHTGFERHEVIGHPILDRYHPSSLEGARHAFETFVATGEVINHELRLLTKDGGYRDVMLNVSAVRDAEGNIVRSRSSWRDITDLKTLESALDLADRSLKDLVMTMPLGWAEHEMVFDDDGEPIDLIWRNVNPLFEEQTGLVADHVLDRRGTEIIPDMRSAEPDVIELYGRVVKEQVSERYEIYFEPLERWFQIYASPTWGNRMSVIFENVTERHKAAEQVAALNAELERSNAELERFAYVASHDLREPLRMVTSYTELLADRYQGQLDERADRYIHHAVSGAHRMQRLIDGLLHLGRAGRGALNLGIVSLRDVVREAVTDLAEDIQRTDARLEVCDLPDVVADPDRVAQVFRNLIGNALKFSRGDRPQIEITAHRAGDDVSVAVRDHGIGIEPEYVDQIFEVFKRLHHRDEYPGTGVGLAIVKTIVERHGGTITVDSTPGEGSTFSFTLQAVPAMVG